MSASDLVLVVAVIAVVVAACALLLLVARLLRSVRALEVASGELRARADELTESLDRTAASAQAELDRVDSLLDAAESVQHVVDGVGQLTRDSVATPLIKARAFVAGTGQAARRIGRPRKVRG